MNDDTSDAGAELPPSLKLLKTLVTLLTLVMIGGVVTVVALLVMRLGAEPPIVPDTITLPDGARAQAFTQGADWYAVVTDTNEILIFDRLTGELRQTVEIAN
ncbi:DUF6476 family protein [Roseobacteraceae bacterium S113]